MKKSMSKALSIVLSVAMLCSSAPTSAYAGGWGHGHGHGHGRGWWFWDYIWDDGSTLEEDNGSEEQPESSDIQDESDANDPLFEDDDQPVDENQAQDGIISDPEEEEETETETETEVSESETGEPGTETQASESETGETGTETPVSESETGEADTETPVSESETGEPGTETQASESETGESGTETPVSESETEVASTESESETGTEVQTTESETDTEAEVLSYTQPVTAQLTADDLQVTVDAPAGAFPDGTTVTAQKVTLDDVDVNGTVLAAADITFLYEGNEVEPKDGAAVSVTIQSAEIAKADADTLSVVHVDDNNEVTPVAESDVHVRDDQVVFDASEFSVYAVVEKGSTEEDARATVNFYGKDQATPLESVYVKNADTLDQLEKIVYDPGAGDLDNSDIFMGWTTEKDYTRDSAAADIDGVRKALADKNDIREGDVINYYAKIATKAEVVYMAEGVVLNRFSNLVYPNSPVDVTVDTIYTPPTEDQGFFGWVPADEASRRNITSAKLGDKNVAGTEADPYTTGTVLTITGDVTLHAFAPAGHWLVFDENGKGATYHAPQFVKNGAVTVNPGDMTRVGYTFGGWYTDKDCTNKFTFGSELAEKTTIYAKWTPNDNAAYTVVIWKQNVDGKSYDFETSIPLTATVGEKVSPVTKKPSLDDAGVDNSYAVINKKTYQWEGFHLGNYDTDVNVNPEGDAIVNVYFDRSEYTLTFMINEGYVETTDTYKQTPKQYYYEDGIFGGYRELTYRNGKWQYRSWGSWYTYTGTRYKYIQGGTVKTITALYGQKIRDQFNPLIGNDGTKYNDSWNVDETPNGKFTINKQLSFLDTMPADNTVFTYYTYSGRYTYTFNFYLENLPGAMKKYKLAHSYVVKATGLASTEDEDFINLEGFTKEYSNPSYTNKRYEFGYEDSHIDFYYTRNQHSIIYQDGTCYGKETVPATKAVLNQVDGVYYEQNLASFANGYTPTKIGYTFAGWYSDETCTVPYEFTGTMPDHNIVVYAKWQQNEYRVFLHPNVDASDGSLGWGSDSQAMNFRVYDGEKISLPTGERDEYELIGWYSDAACTNSFNEETRINTTTVAAIGSDYDQTKHMTDPMDKYGNITGTGTNSDAEKGRTWITKEVNLYAKWRSKLLGAKGITVVYDAGDGTNAPVDDELYLDQARAIAEAASTAPAGKKFSHWVVQKWDEATKAYVDTEATVKPGDEFTVLRTDAKVVANEDNTEDNPSYTYTVQLRAEYVDEERPEYTEIHWHSNIQDVLGNTLTVDLTRPGDATPNTQLANDYFVTDVLKDDGTSGLEINKAVDIRSANTFSYSGMTFLGWAKTANANETELFLKWNESTGKYTTTEGTEVKEVSQVAADLKDPAAGNDLYACWQGKFYIYHSGVARDGNLQTVPMNHGQMPNGTYDLASTVTPGTLYGGYYLDYAGKGSYAGDGKKTSDGVKYNGMNVTWKLDDAQKASGKTLKPVAGETYYIKEVPAYYLLPRYEYTYTMADNKIQSMFLFSAIDDLNYSGIGFVVQEDYKPAKVYKSFTVKAANGTAQAKLTPAILFAEDGLTSGGRLTEYRDDSLIKATSFTVRPYWVTMDAVTVLGSVKRTVNMGDGTINAGGISPSDQTVGAEIQ